MKHFSRILNNLGVGFKYVFFLWFLSGQVIQFDKQQYVSLGLVQPPPTQCVLIHFLILEWDISPSKKNHQSITFSPPGFLLWNIIGIHP